MKNSTFVIPHLRGHGFLLTAMPDLAIGADPTFDDLEAIDVLLEGWSGLLRALALAGYRCVELFVEIDPMNAVERLLCNPATLGAGMAELADDELGDVRATAPAMMVALTLDPLSPFDEPSSAPIAPFSSLGKPVGAPIALDLPKATIEAIDGVVAPVSRTERGWIAFTSDESSLHAGRNQLIDGGVAVADALADTIAGAWALQPDPRGAPTGLGFLFDDRNWWFPPRAPDRPDSPARLLHDVLGAVAGPLRAGAADIPSFIRQQVVRRRDPRTLTPGGSFAELTRAWTSKDPTVGVDAYRDRVDGLVVADTGVAMVSITDILDGRFMWTDAVMLMVEHGAIGVAHRLLPGVPSTSLSGMPLPSTPEWTIPQLTGQWDAKPGSTRNDTLILNQSGTLISGYWQLHHHALPLERWQLSGKQSADNRNGGPLTFDVEVWPQPAPDDPPPAQTIAGQLVVAAIAGAVPDLTLDVDIGIRGEHGYLFAKTLGVIDDAHVTESSMFGLSEPQKAKFRALRDAPLHYKEQQGAAILLKIAIDHIVRYLEELPDLQGLRDLMDDFRDAVNTNRAAIPMLDNKELLATSGYYIKQVLSKVHPSGEDDALSKLVEMLRYTYVWPSSLEIQQFYDLVFFPDGYDLDFQYQWRITNVSILGAGFGLGGAAGQGTFELRRVGTDGAQIGPVTSRTIDLLVEQAGSIVEEPGFKDLPADLSQWMMLWPTNRDIVPALDGATLSLCGFSGSVLIFESAGTMEVELAPNDHLPPLRGLVSPPLLSVPIVNPLGDDATPDDIKDRAEAIKDLIDGLKDVGKQVAKRGFKGLKSAKQLLKPKAHFSNVDGWIRNAADTSFKPEVAPVPVETYSQKKETWARFGTGKYELTTDFRDAIRQFLLDHLPLLAAIGEVTIEGNASQVGQPDYNTRLSRDRASSVLTAMYDILGPQLATPWGDLVVRGLGSSQSTGPPGSDLDIDRRVDVIIRGAVRLRS
jgi:outer membrane protein OmpA-like peptidoglycan-associated protein